METTQKRTYIRMRNIEFRPGGRLRLGTLLTKSRDPNSLVPNSSAITPCDADVQSTIQTDWSDNFVQNHGNKGGIYTKFLSGLLPVTADIGLERSGTRTMRAKVARLESLHFVPSKDYLESVMADTTVQIHLSREKFRSNIYVVTGVKHAYESVVTDIVEKGTDYDLGIDGNGTALGVPAEAGMTFKHKSMQSMGHSHQGSSDYVYAYQVKEVRYSKWQQQIVMRDVNGGALYHNDNSGATNIQDSWNQENDPPLYRNEILTELSGQKGKSVQHIFFMYGLQQMFSANPYPEGPRKIETLRVSNGWNLSEDEMKRVESIGKAVKVTVARLEGSGIVTVKQMFGGVLPKEGLEVVVDDDGSEECEIVDCV